MKQLYANNAKTTLVNSVLSTDLSFLVVDASLFPVTSTPQDFFLVTLEAAGQIEICRASGWSGNTISITARGLEGTSAANFPAGSRVECRVTKQTLNYYSRAFAPLASLDLLVAPNDSYQDGYLCGTADTHGAYSQLMARATGNTWGLLNYQTFLTGSATGGTTTSALTTLGAGLSSITSGKFFVQFTSGPYIGYMREILNTSTSSQINWATALPGAITNGTTLEIFKANSALLDEMVALTNQDDPIIAALVFGRK